MATARATNNLLTTDRAIVNSAVVPDASSTTAEEDELSPGEELGSFGGVSDPLSGRGTTSSSSGGRATCGTAPRDHSIRVSSSVDSRSTRMTGKISTLSKCKREFCSLYSLSLSSLMLLGGSNITSEESERSTQQFR